MKYFLGLSLLLTLNLSFASDCKDMCKQNDKQCKQMVKGAEKMTLSLIDQMSIDRSMEKEMKRDVKSQIKVLKFDCKEQRSLCFDMCRG